MRIPSALLVLALSLVPTGAAADFWPSKGERSDYELAMKAADDAAIEAAEVARRSAERAQRLAVLAVERYERAAALEPANPEPHYRAAEILNTYFINSKPASPRTIKRAIEHWTEYERLAPRDPRLENVLFRRSIAFTKLGGDKNFKSGIEDYEAHLALMDQTSSRAEAVARVLGNKAEMHMLVGELDISITNYRRALEYRDSALHAYGLAVALDRDGQGVKARELMYSYAYGNRLRDLESGDVFFVPEGELHYYKGLGFEALGNKKKAIQHYRQYLRALPNERFAPRARENLENLTRRGRSKGGR